MKIEILGGNEIGRLPGLSDASASVAARYVAALVKAGPGFYVDNADVAMKALVIDGKALPLVINRGAIRNAHVCSPWRTMSIIRWNASAVSGQRRGALLDPPLRCGLGR